MISPVLALLLASASAQPADPAGPSRTAFGTCLRRYAERSAQDRMSPDDFDSALPNQCRDQETAFRNAVIQRETGFGTRRERAERDAEEEVEDLRDNTREMFRIAIEPR